jgi:hypothetical protein
MRQKVPLAASMAAILKKGVSFVAPTMLRHDVAKQTDLLPLCDLWEEASSEF